MSKQVDLVEVIKANPGCVAIVDNDCWTLYRENPDNNPWRDAEDEDGYKQSSEWDEINKLATDYTIKPIGDGGYGSGSCYGGDILQALALIVGIKVESV